MALQYLAVAGLLFRRVEKSLSSNSMRHVGDEFRIILDAHTSALPAVDFWVSFSLLPDIESVGELPNWN
ncbi:hypothetical protein CDAR_425681 [Caerostris darwini]|uniref:Uncharacterized protein n=1 Tax=Caerostris darwini TaxID=1538125 RepID=A0AAV4N226_9ARAC|nr:hypothetical protein CDAR_425681 [Caerostris darwini]